MANGLHISVRQRPWKADSGLHHGQDSACLIGRQASTDEHMFFLLVSGHDPGVVLSNLDCILLQTWGDIFHLDREHHDEMALLSKGERLRRCRFRIGPKGVRLTIAAHSFRARSHATPVVDIGVNTEAIGEDFEAHLRNVGAPAASSGDSAAHSDDAPEEDHISDPTDKADDNASSKETAAESALRSIRSKHCLIHDDMHAHPGCEACVRAKTTRGLHRKHTEPRYLRNW